VRQWLINLRYLLAPLVMLMSVLGVAVGGPWLWTGYVWLGLLIVADALATKQLPVGARDGAGADLGIPALQYTVMYGMLVLSALLQLVLAARIYQYTGGAWATTFLDPVMGAPLTLNDLIDCTLADATVILGALAGITALYGHELAHQKGYRFVLGRWMMALIGVAHYCYAHVYNHHLDLGCEADPITPPRGRSLYTHFLLAYFGESRFVYRMEQERLAREGVPFLSWRNRWLRGYAMTFPSILVFWYAGGWLGLACLSVVWTLANFFHQGINYLQHYGLIREPGNPIEYRHSWDNSTPVTACFFIEVGRQADHHERGETPFWDLNEVGAPNTGIGYFSEFVLAMIPPLWRAFMDKQLARWDRERASPGEKAIAEMLRTQGSRAAV
jgi:hypothetical protein